MYRKQSQKVKRVVEKKENRDCIKEKMANVPVPAASNPMRPVLPSTGTATVKSVLSGDTVVLLGRPVTPGGKAPVVVFTFERVTAPR